MGGCIVITFENVTKTYHNGKQIVHALNGIDLTIERGEIFGVVGFSGAGKSSLLRCVNLLERPTTGRVLVEGQDITQFSKAELRQHRRRVGMVFQHFNLLNSKTVFANVAEPLVIAKVPNAEIRKRVMELLEFVGLADKANHYPDQLSGGQKQRVGIARALATRPSILLCDEATSALDPQTTSAILSLLKTINREYRITILLVTHEMSVIREICDKVAVMERGKVIESGSVFDVFSNPQSDITKNFVNSVMHTKIPESVQRLLSEPEGGNRRVYQLVFVGASATQPVLFQAAKKFNLDINILFGNITELQGVPFGHLLVEFRGPEREINRALTYVREAQVDIQEAVGYGH